MRGDMVYRMVVKLADKHLKKLTLVSVAAYIFMFAICAKGVFLYVNHHPAKNKLLSVHGIIKDVRLGGNGCSSQATVGHP